MELLVLNFEGSGGAGEVQGEATDILNGIPGWIAYYLYFAPVPPGYEGCL